MSEDKKVRTTTPVTTSMPKIVGLTKREFFSAMVLQGLVAKDGHNMNQSIIEKTPLFVDAALNFLGSDGDERVF